VIGLVVVRKHFLHEGRTSAMRSTGRRRPRLSLFRGSYDGNRQLAVRYGCLPDRSESARRILELRGTAFGIDRHGAVSVRPIGQFRPFKKGDIFSN